MDGNDYAALISLSASTDREAELRKIGHRLADLLYDYARIQLAVDKSQAINKIDQIAADIIEEDISSSSRREMTKRTSTLLLNLLNRGSLEAAATVSPFEEDEV